MVEILEQDKKYSIVRLPTKFANYLKQYPLDFPTKAELLKIKRAKTSIKKKGTISFLDLKKKIGYGL
jgi:hypothetical protein